MIQNAIYKKGETLVSIIIGIMIMAIAISGVAAILIHNKTIDEDYNTDNNIFLLQSNAESIIQKTDTSILVEKDIFYLYKNPTTRIFQVFTGASNDKYKYINRDGELVTNTGTSYTGTIYTRLFTIEKKDASSGAPRQIIKGGIKELIRK